MLTRNLRNSAIGLFILTLLCLPTAGWCEFPERAITILVGNEAGGTSDIITRALAIGTEKYLGKPLLVENRGGGGGAVALGAILTAKADGYTLAAVPNDTLVNTALMQKVPFKPLKDFVPIIGHSSSENTSLLVKNDSQWKTFAEFIDYAKKNPGKIKYSSAGIGTGMHTSMAVIAQKDNIKWVHVPFKGTAPARTALMGGHVDACASGMDWVGFAQAGQVRVLVTHGRARMVAFPNVPTLKELGYDFVSETIHSIVGPAGIPAEVVKKLETAFLKGTETQEFKNAQERLALTPVMFMSKDYERHLKEHWVKLEKIFKEAGIIKEAASQPY
jgi:tripartite-type tricarboxylate transporter receptor subunit TctC